MRNTGGDRRGGGKYVTDANTLRPASEIGGEPVKDMGRDAKRLKFRQKNTVADRIKSFFNI